MNRTRSAAAPAGAVVVLAALVAGCGSGSSDQPSATSSTTSSTSSSTPTTATSPTATTGSADAKKNAAAIVAAAKTFVKSLTTAQQGAVQFKWTDTAQKQRWSNLPQGLYTRAGVRWGDLSTGAQKAWLAVMQATLSDQGYNRVLGEWHADDQLAGSGGGGPGGGTNYGRDNYWIALIGAPSTTDPWQWQWGGHHVTVNATLKGADLSLTPSFIGAQPTTYTEAGKKVQPLADIDGTAFDLLSSLSSAQRKKAVLGDTYIDLVLGPGQDGRTIQNEGISGADLKANQKALLLQLVSYYANLAETPWSTARVAQLKADLDQTYFVWYGPQAEGQAYFRANGPHVVIEYSPQQMGGDPSEHIHGIYRDPTNDYGSGFTG